MSPCRRKFILAILQPFFLSKRGISFGCRPACHGPDDRDIDAKLAQFKGRTHHILLVN